MAKKVKSSFRQQVEQQLITTFDLKGTQAENKKVKRSLRKASKILSKALKPTKPAKATQPVKLTKLEKAVETAAVN